MSTVLAAAGRCPRAGRRRTELDSNEGLLPTHKALAAVNFTKHAARRSQQRQVPKMLVDLLMQFGESTKSFDGTSKLFFDKAAKRRIQTYAGAFASHLSEHLNVFAVVSAEQSVITVGYLHERIRRH